MSWFLSPEVSLPYHPIIYNTTTVKPLIPSIITFISEYNITSNGNNTLLSLDTVNRILSGDSYFTLLYHQEHIIATMITIMLPVENNKGKFYSSYTSYLCIHPDYRQQKLSSLLIYSLRQYLTDINHGYYLSAIDHHTGGKVIQAWYRPVNLINTIKAGFQIQSFSRPHDRNPKLALTRQKIAYNIIEPKVIAVKARPQDYTLVCNLLKSGDIWLSPSYKEYLKLCKVFDLYLVGDSGLFLLFPLHSIITSSRQRVFNYQLSLMIGDVMDSVLWTAKELKCDLLYGWLTADVTATTIMQTRGIIASGYLYLEFYQEAAIDAERFTLPLI